MLPTQRSRFQNAVVTLKDCADHMDDEDCSKKERLAKVKLVELCVLMGDEYPIEELECE